jgi:hypothetical protein
MNLAAVMNRWLWKTKKRMDIIKAGGLAVEFDAEKLRQSLLRAGATPQQAGDILQKIRPQLHHQMRSKEVFRLAFQQLKKMGRPLAARYNLKKAISDLGPSGFPFEQLIARILQRQGYSVLTGQFFEGRCVTHEVDVVATKNGDTLLTECKFHHAAGVVTNIKTPLYIHARYHDIKLNWPADRAAPTAMLATNTRFSEDSIRYGLCAGIRLMSWDYPAGNSIRELTDRFELHPLTCLSTLTMREKAALLDKKLVLIEDICRNGKVLEEIGLSEQRQKAVLEEARGVCHV